MAVRTSFYTSFPATQTTPVTFKLTTRTSFSTSKPLLTDVINSNLVKNSKNFFPNALEPQQLLGYLETDVGLLNCLSNCSNNGQCQFDNTTSLFSCKCDDYFTGTNCGTNQKPCASNVCHNNGDCSQTLKPNSLNVFVYNCTCNSRFTGRYCEKRVDFCKKTKRNCSGNGYCKSNKNASSNYTACRCFTSYSGDDCQFKSRHLEANSVITALATTVAVIFNVSLVLLLVGMDLRNLQNNCLHKKINVQTIRVTLKNNYF